MAEDSPPRSLSPAQRIALQTIAVVLTLVWAALQWGLVGYTLEHSIAPAEIRADGGHRYVWRIPFIPLVRSDTAHTTDSRLAVFENGHPIGPAHSATVDVAGLGEGRFRHQGGYLYFSASDNSDPYSSGHSYRIQAPLALPSMVDGLIALFLVVAFIAPLARAYRWLARSHPAVPTLLLMLLAVGYRASLWALYGYDTVGGAVKGLPFSDAFGWNAQAIEFAQGVNLWESGWDARRQGYTWLLGGLYAITGESLTAARCFNIAAGVLSAGLIFDLFRRMLPFAVALLAGASYALLTPDALISLTTMTEPLGSFLTNLSLWLFVMGILAWRGDGQVRRAAVWMVLAGAMLALSNLVRPLTILAAAPLALMPLMYIRKGSPFNLRRTLTVGVIFGVGVTVTLAPWLARQYHHYGIMSISDNTAEILYAATSPEYGHWVGEISLLTTSTDISERYVFYNRGVSEHLSQHALWYVKNIVTSIAEGFYKLTPHRWLVIALIVLFLLHYRRPASGYPWPLLAMVGILLCSLLAPGRFIYPLLTACLLIAGGAVALARRHRVVPVVLLLGATLFSMGLVAFPSRRMTQSLEWMSIALVLWVIWEALSFAAKVPVEERDRRSWGPLGGKVMGVGIAAALLLSSGVVLASVRSFHPAPAPANTVSATQTAAYVEQARTQAGEVTLPANLRVWRAHLMFGQVMRFSAHEVTKHWSPLFAPRPYPHTDFYIAPPIIGDPVVFAGELPEWALSGADMVVVGSFIPRPHGRSIEAFALAPADVDDGPLLLPAPPLLAQHAAYVREVQQSLLAATSPAIDASPPAQSALQTRPQAAPATGQEKPSGWAD